jgi:hypothetical protein
LGNLGDAFITFWTTVTAGFRVSTQIRAEPQPSRYSEHCDGGDLRDRGPATTTSTSTFPFTSIVLFQA